MKTNFATYCQRLLTLKTIFENELCNLLSTIADKNELCNLLSTIADIENELCNLLSTIIHTINNLMLAYAMFEAWVVRWLPNAWITAQKFGNRCPLHTISLHSRKLCFCSQQHHDCFCRVWEYKCGWVCWWWNSISWNGIQTVKSCS